MPLPPQDRPPTQQKYRRTCQHDMCSLCHLLLGASFALADGYLPQSLDTAYLDSPTPVCYYRHCCYLGMGINDGGTSPWFEFEFCEFWVEASQLFRYDVCV